VCMGNQGSEVKMSRLQHGGTVARIHGGLRVVRALEESKRLLACCC
jgi:hypothetical protein